MTTGGHLRAIIAVVAGMNGAVAAQDTSSAVASAPAYVILMQDFSTTECDRQQCGWLGKPLLDAILALENKSRRNSLQAQLSVLRTELPDLDLYALARAAFCSELMLETASDCAQVTVLGPGSRAPVERQAGTLIVKLSVEYTRQMRVNELRVIAALSEVVAGKDQPILYIWYVTPGGDVTQSSPLDSPAATPTGKQLATHAHWFGEDRLMETELRQAIPEVARMIREMAPYLPRFGAATKTWDSLPVMADLEAEGKLACRGVACGFHVLGSTDRRVWFMQQADAPVIMSTPLASWK